VVLAAKNVARLKMVRILATVLGSAYPGLLPVPDREVGRNQEEEGHSQGADHV